MPKFSKISQKRLDTCHPDLQVIFKEIVKYFDCSILCGERDKVKQEIAFTNGFSKVRFPFSKHNTNPSMAVDVVPYPINWKDTNRMRFFAGYVLATAQQLFNEGKIKHKIKWGGDWDSDTETNDQRFDDLPHFEIIN